jgi:hypothetical protein
MEPGMQETRQAPRQVRSGKLGRKANKQAGRAEKVGWARLAGNQASK